MIDSMKNKKRRNLHHLQYKLYNHHTFDSFLPSPTKSYHCLSKQANKRQALSLIFQGLRSIGLVDAEKLLRNSQIIQISQVSNKTAHVIFIYLHSSNKPMALRRQDTTTHPQLNEGLSKREQRKLQQTLKLFPSQVHLTCKRNKKRKGAEKEIRIVPVGESSECAKPLLARGEDAQILADTRQQSQFNSTPNRQLANEAAKSPITDEHPKKDPENLQNEGFFNTNYPLAAQFSTILDFLTQYSYRQMEKTIQKVGCDFQEFNHQGDPLKSLPNDASTQLTGKIRSLIAGYRGALDRTPFSKAHLALSAAISKQGK